MSLVGSKNCLGWNKIFLKVNNAVEEKVEKADRRKNTLICIFQMFSRTICQELNKYE